jgi:DNA-binding MarR family transcriptional regulator
VDDDRLLNLLGALAVGLADRIAAATEETLGESATAVAALVTIAQFPGFSIEQVRHALGLSHSATVRVVDRLTARGLVAREAAERGPAVALVPTAPGRRLAARVLAVRRRVVSEIADDLPGDLGEAIETLLDRLTVDVETGHRICRLCDVATCPQDRCPVADRQLALTKLSGKAQDRPPRRP